LIPYRQYHQPYFPIASSQHFSPNVAFTNLIHTQSDGLQTWLAFSAFIKSLLFLIS
jgi:hypothetical protein